ncbi:MAG: tetratricopeptide repeat protein, partial [Nannocystaceae bacterium]|nr:tetratricopeptide repeat protein [Nannocystaceae bacterium]
MCTGLDDKLAGVWDDTRRATIKAAVIDTGLSYAPSTWTHVEAALDGYAAQWVAARTDACEATHRGEQSSELLDRRMACLDERLEYLSTTTDVLATADSTVVDHAIVAVSSLPKLRRCADIEALNAKRPPPEDPERARRVTELDTRLAKASALHDAAKYEASLQAVAAIVDEASEVQYAPLQARAWLLLGEVQVQRSEYDLAADSLAKAYDLALGQRMFDEAASASALLMHMFGYYLELHEQGEVWAAQADPLSRAVGTDEARALFLNNRGAMTLAAGRPELARDDHAQALALRRAALGPDHPDVAGSLTHLGNVARDLGNGPEALGYYQSAFSIRERVFGKEHPIVGASLYNMGTAARTMGDSVRAQAWLEQALSIRRTALGPRHPYVASTLYQLGSVARLARNYEQSRIHHEAAFAIWRETLGAEHPDVAWGYSDLGRGALTRGEFDLAREHYTRALQIRESSLGPKHPLVPRSLNALGEVARTRGAHNEARKFHTRALEVATQADSPAQRAESLLGLGLVALATGDHGDAVAPLEQALHVRQSGALSPATLDEIRFALARALWNAESATPLDHRRARELANSATFKHGEQAAQLRA